MTSHLGDLFAGERVLWTGSPQRYPFFNRRDIVTVPVTLAIGALLALAVQRMPVPNGEPLQTMMSWFFIAVAVYRTAGLIIARNLYLRSAQYRITTQRVIIESKLFGRHNVHSAYLRDLPPPLIKQHDDGVGTITFGTTNLRYDVKITRDGIHVENPELPPALVAVSHAQHVRGLIVSARDGASPRGDRVDER